ncbi:Lrp/AsnC family transcriptional regulator [Candidatus Woesearchaeota archaeon]|nr:Lrp/AsnC family transcriptional regulator [Candidatus Woesearchaeota archaeon]MBW3005476.1 Lrp/AsnC family transcriptional regulator [Candidatus Woesearchaeota archaeon]
MISEKDLQIVKQLRQNARTNLASIASATNTPKSTVFDRIGKLEEDVIKKHASIVDFKKLGYHARYVFLIRVKPDCRESLREFLSSQPCVNNLHITNSDFDFLFEAIFKDNKEMNDFKSELDSNFPITQIRQHELIEDLYREQFRGGNI